MSDAPDAELLEQFARNDSEAAFAELVRRHLALVHSVALRHTADAEHAQDITQAVFIILARKASSLGRKTVLSGWLYHTARLTAANFRRSEARRIRREQETFMQSTLDETPSDEVWSEIAPLLDEAMSRLGRTDRDAIVLRYFENKNLREVGAALGLRERAAQKRVARSLEKLRAFLAKHGVVSTTAIVAGAISANSVQAAPASAVLAKSVTTVAIAKGAAASASTLTLIKGALKVMAWTKIKTAALAAGGILLVSGATVVTVRAAREVASVRDTSVVWDAYSQLFGQGLTADETAKAADEIMKKHPPMALIRLSPQQRIDPNRIGTGIGRPTGIGTPQGHVRMGAFLGEVLRYVYNVPQFPQNRIIVPSDLAASRYDYVDTMPQGGREILQRALNDQFGLVVRREMHSNLVLTVKNPNASGLHKHTDDANASGFRVRNATMAQLATALGRRMGIKVTDQTGLVGGFDYTLEVPNPASPTPDELRKALLDQLGLELIPAADGQEYEFIVVGQLGKGL